MDQSQSLIIYGIAYVVSLIIIYYIIKSAVKNGTMEAQSEMKTMGMTLQQREDLRNLESRYQNTDMSKEDYEKAKSRLLSS